MSINLSRGIRVDSTCLDPLIHLNVGDPTEVNLIEPAPAPFYFTSEGSEGHDHTSAEGWATHVLEKRLGEPWVIRLTLTEENKHLVESRLFGGYNAPDGRKYRPISYDELRPGGEVCLNLAGLTSNEIQLLQVELGSPEKPEGSFQYRLYGETRI
jgi:hypothetical protein